MTSYCILSKPSVTVYVTELIIQVQVSLTKESSGVEVLEFYSLSRARSRADTGRGGVVGFSKGHLSNGSL